MCIRAPNIGDQTSEFFLLTVLISASPREEAIPENQKATFELS